MTAEPVGEVAGTQSMPAGSDGASQWDANISQTLASKRKPGVDYGIRVLPEDVPYGTKPGDALWPSSRWEDGEPVGDPLPGTSTIDVGDGSPEAIAKALKQADSYDGSRVVLVSGKRAGAGEDPGEVLLSDAKVEAIWEKDGPDPGPIVRRVDAQAAATPRSAPDPRPLPPDPEPESVTTAAARVGKDTPELQQFAEDMGLEDSSVVDMDLNELRRSGALTEADEAALKAADEETKMAESVALSYETLSTCVLRYGT